MIARASCISWSALILASYAVLYRLRAFDENALFSWNDIFKGGMAEVFLLFIFCLLLSYVISHAKFDIKNWDVPAIFFSAFLLSGVFWSAPEIHSDAGRYFAEAKYLEEYGVRSFIRDWGVELNVMSDFPAVPFIYGLIFRFVGESGTYIHVFVTSLFAATCVLTFLIGRRLWGRDTGIYAALFLLSFPYLLSYPSMLVEVPLIFFLTAAVYSTLNALDPRRGKAWIAVSAASILLTVLSKASGILLLSVIPVIFAVTYLKTRDRAVLYRSASIALLSGTLIILFVSCKFDVLTGMLSVLKAFKLRTADSHEASLSLLFFQISPLVTLLALCSFYFAFKKRDANRLILMVWFLVPFIFFYDTRIRFTAPALPAVAIMAALALGEIRHERSRKFLASGIIMCSIVVAVFAYLPFMHAHSEMNIKYAAEYTDAIKSETTEVYVILPEGYLHNYSEMEYRHRHTLDVLIPIFDLYSDKKIATPKYRQIDAPPVTDWTWQYNHPPPYYLRRSGHENAIVVITPVSLKKIPENLEKRLEGRYRLAKVYGERDFSRRGPYIIKVYVPVIFI